jgi:hypothetical protein
MIGKKFERASRCLSFPLSQEVHCFEISDVPSNFDPLLFQSQPVSIIFQIHFRSGSTNGSIAAPPLIDLMEDDWEPDYNDLDFDSLDWRNFRRSIRKRFDEYKEISASFVAVSALPSIPACRSMSWQALRFPVCNIVHEVELDGRNNVYLG